MSLYHIKAELNPCKLVPEFGEIIDELNDNLKEFDSSFPEVGIKSEVKLGELSVIKILSENDKRLIIQIMQDEFDKKQPDWGVQILGLELQ